METAHASNFVILNTRTKTYLVLKISVCNEYLLVFCMVFKNKLQMIVDVRLKLKIKKQISRALHFLFACFNQLIDSMADSL